MRISSMKVDSPETQEEPMFQFKSEGQKRLMSQLKAVKQEKFPGTSGRGKLFSYSSFH